SNAADELRAHLKSLGHPEWSTDGEKRASEIERELAQGTVAKLLPPPAPFTEVAKSEPAAPGAPSAPPVEKPSFALSANSAAPQPNFPIAPGAIGVPAPTIDEAPVKLVLPTGRALQWPSFAALEKLTDEGNPDALAALGQILLEGKILTEDVPRAIAL